MPPVCLLRALASLLPYLDVLLLLPWVVCKQPGVAKKVHRHCFPPLVTIAVYSGDAKAVSGDAKAFLKIAILTLLGKQRCKRLWHACCPFLVSRSPRGDVRGALSNSWLRTELPRRQACAGSLFREGPDPRELVYV